MCLSSFSKVAQAHSHGSLRVPSAARQQALTQALLKRLLVAHLLMWLMLAKQVTWPSPDLLDGEIELACEWEYRKATLLMGISTGMK